jgi:hypothetical protein
MNKPRFTPEFKEEAARQMLERGFEIISRKHIDAIG